MKKKNYERYPTGRKEDPKSVGDRLHRDSGKTFRREMQNFVLDRMAGGDGYGTIDHGDKVFERIPEFPTHTGRMPGGGEIEVARNPKARRNF